MTEKGKTESEKKNIFFGSRGEQDGGRKGEQMNPLTVQHNTELDPWRMNPKIQRPGSNSSNGELLLLIYKCGFYRWEIKQPSKDYDGPHLKSAKNRVVIVSVVENFTSHSCAMQMIFMVGWLVCRSGNLRHINPCGLFMAKSCLSIHLSIYLSMICKRIICK